MNSVVRYKYSEAEKRNVGVPLASMVMAWRTHNPYDLMTRPPAPVVHYPSPTYLRVQKLGLGRDPHCIEVPSFERR